jgi:hypothetical protein
VAAGQWWENSCLTNFWRVVLHTSAVLCTQAQAGGSWTCEDSCGGSAGEGAPSTFTCRKGEAGTHIGEGALWECQGKIDGGRISISHSQRRKRGRSAGKNTKDRNQVGAALCLLLPCCTCTSFLPCVLPCADVTSGGGAAASAALVERNAQLPLQGLCLCSSCRRCGSNCMGWGARAAATRCYAYLRVRSSFRAIDRRRNWLARCVAK